MARTNTHAKPASLGEIKNHAKRLAYLRAADKILVALANEYGAYRKLPSRASIEAMLEERNGKARRVEGRAL